MVIPKDVERYNVGEGIRVAGQSLTPGKVSSIYRHPKIWVVRIQKMRWKQRIVSGLNLRSNSGGMKTLQSITSTSDDLNELKYLQSILASKVVNYWCVNFLADDMNQSYLGKIPIPSVDFNDPADKARHDHIVQLVERMLAAKEELSKAKTESETTRLERECEALDRQIDQAVYELYGLTEEEIRVVEGK